MGPLRSIISYAAHAIYHLKGFSIEFLLSLSVFLSPYLYHSLSSSTRSLPSAFKFLNLKRIYRFERDTLTGRGAWLSGPLTRVKTWTKNNEKCSLLSSAACVGGRERESVAYACRHFRPGLLIIILWRKTTTQLVQMGWGMGAGSISGRRLCLMDERRDLAANQRAIYMYNVRISDVCSGSI